MLDAIQNRGAQRSTQQTRSHKLDLGPGIGKWDNCFAASHLTTAQLSSFVTAQLTTSQPGNRATSSIAKFTTP